MIKIVCLLIVVVLFSDQEIIPEDYYFGGWPVNPNKEQIASPNFTPDCTGSKKGALCSCTINEECLSGTCFSSPKAGKYCLQSSGTLFPRFILKDQFGEDVDIYDFGDHGKFIIIEMSTSWCKPCKELADWISNDVPNVTGNRWWKKEYDIIRDLIAQERIYFINILLQDIYKEPATLRTLEDWYQMYSDEKVPILADSDYNVRDWMRVSGYPTIIVLNEKMEIVQFSLRGWHDAFNFISNLDWEINKNTNHE